MSMEIIYFVTRLVTVALFLIAIGLAVKAKWGATMEAWMYWLILATGMLIVVQWTTSVMWWIALALYALCAWHFGWHFGQALKKARIRHRQAGMIRRSHDADL